jgi:hypothetical protein
MEYAYILMSHLTHNLLKKVIHITTSDIKITFQLPPCMMKVWTYSHIDFEPIMDHLETLASDFLNKNNSDPLIGELIGKPSTFVKSPPTWVK